MVKLLVSLLPVFVFLVGLIFIDSYRLVKLRAVVVAIVMGCAAAVLSVLVNDGLSASLALSPTAYSRYIAPVVEESLKALYLTYLISSNRVGFMVDAAIFGVAIGAGFAFVENVYYLQTLATANVMVWIVRGFGTALMHGAAVAIFGIIAKGRSERHPREQAFAFLPGLAAAVVLHSFYNHFLLPPLVTTLILLAVLPPLVLLIFDLSEKATRDWLGVGMDTDVWVLEMITGGSISDTRIGRYLESMQQSFPGEIVADMLCLLRIYLELAVRAKGVLMLKGTGIEVEPDPEIAAKFAELEYLEKSIGRTGKLALQPLLHVSGRDLWQLRMLSRDNR